VKKREIQNGEERNRYGITASFSTNDGLRRSYTAKPPAGKGGPLAALALIVAEVDLREDGPWYLDAVSTPQTIYDDMHRTDVRPNMILFRESSMLARLGRKDLLRNPNPSARGVSVFEPWQVQYGSRRRLKP